MAKVYPVDPASPIHVGIVLVTAALPLVVSEEAGREFAKDRRLRVEFETLRTVTVPPSTYAEDDSQAVAEAIAAIPEPPRLPRFARGRRFRGRPVEDPPVETIPAVPDTPPAENEE